MFLALSAPTYDLDGAILLRASEASDAWTVSRRVSRSATLDGNAALSDSGYSNSDLTFDLEIPNITKSQNILVEYLTKTYSLLGISLLGAVYNGVVEQYTLQAGNGRLRFLVKEKLSA